MERVLAEIQKARAELDRNPVEDDGLTELSIAATPDSMCYVDAESARLVLDWIERVINYETKLEKVRENLVASWEADAPRDQPGKDKFADTKNRLADALQGVKDSVAGA